VTWHVQLATVNAEQLKKLQDLERELGTYVVAYTQPLTPAQLSPKQVARLQALEKELGLCLVAYRKGQALRGGLGSAGADTA
jgi:hypothetical protein